MNMVKKDTSSLLVAALTAVVIIISRLTCVFILHQPKMPEELNDFRKYDK